MNPTALISPDDAKVLISNGAILIDIREPDEYASENISGAINISLSSWRSECFDTYTKDKKNPLAGVISASFPAFTMIDDKIGIIGKIHGVKDNPRPARKKNPNTKRKLPFLSKFAIESVSFTA